MASGRIKGLDAARMRLRRARLSLVDWFGPAPHAPGARCVHCARLLRADTPGRVCGSQECALEEWATWNS